MGTKYLLSLAKIRLTWVSKRCSRSCLHMESMNADKIISFMFKFHVHIIPFMYISYLLFTYRTFHVYISSLMYILHLSNTYHSLHVCIVKHRVSINGFNTWLAMSNTSCNKATCCCTSSSYSWFNWWKKTKILRAENISMISYTLRKHHKRNKQEGNLNNSRLPVWF